MARQTVNRHIHGLVKRVGRAPINITCHTFRHSFAIHLLLHGRPLKIVSQLLAHKSIESTEIYTNVLAVDGGAFLGRGGFSLMDGFRPNAVILKRASTPLIRIT
ncbi:MAG: hypothetical protein ACJAZ7_001446 [Zhongshania aliphaticivorans]|jgi:hypothetical protein